MTVSDAVWAGRRVLVTGHTGFKGGWLAHWLAGLGAHVTGLALPPAHPGGFSAAVRLEERIDAHLVDLTDRPGVDWVVRRAQPEVVFHLAAQALVPVSIKHPATTYATNVVGTANLLEALRTVSPAVVLVITSDKVYANDGRGRAFSEDDRLGGGDPYSASKAAVEILVDSWRHTYPSDPMVLATARAGNVIGGGDLAPGRLVPDVIRSVTSQQPVRLRNPGALRPWQFVLDPLAGYLCYAERLLMQPVGVPLALNFGPSGPATFTVAQLAELVLATWGAGSWESDSPNSAAAVEATTLALDASLAERTLGWRTLLDVPEAVEWTVAWARAAEAGIDVVDVTDEQIANYRSRMHR